MDIDEKLNSSDVLAPESPVRSSIAIPAGLRAKRVLRPLLVVGLALVAILIITLPNYVEGKDYISFWSAGHLLLHHADPYSPSGVFALQKAHGSRQAVPIIMRNPSASAFPLLFDTHVWQHYFAMVRSARLGIEVFPTASMQLRVLIDPHAFWLLFVPTSFALLWALWYYARSRKSWDWRIHGMLLMLMAVLCSPYGGISDETVLVPAILYGLASALRPRSSAWILMIPNTLALGIVFSHASLTSRAYLWTPFAWLAWFLYATKATSAHNKLLPSQEAVDELVPVR